MKRKIYGPVIGSHLGKEIFETVEEDSHKYIFDRIAEGDDDGYPLNQLKKNEVLFEPGLIYKQAS
ncbi:MAG TPA: hypothetical protein ENI65_09265 [Gammaproteobacteria bacterium]|nr:hypothetical protein [Gammaproteobacteria bacterium]